MREIFEYAILRVVPAVEREEFMNVGVASFCEARSELAVRVAVDESRLRAFALHLDFEEVRRHLDAFASVCRGGADAGPIGELSPRERWRWLVAPRSTILQTSAAHPAMSDNPDALLEHILDRMVRPFKPIGGG